MRKKERILCHSLLSAISCGMFSSIQGLFLFVTDMSALIPVVDVAFAYIRIATIMPRLGFRT